MPLVAHDSVLWKYLSPELRDLIKDGESLVQFASNSRGVYAISDFSFIVFPFSKAYEGFLKMFLLDIGLIHEEEYYSDSIRIGRILNPHFSHEQDNVFNRICNKSRSNRGSEISHRLWEVWQRGRNRVFHYFPHNFRKLSYEEAMEIVNDLVGVMTVAASECRV